MKSHNVKEYLDLCLDLEEKGVSIELLLVIYEEPYVNVKPCYRVEYVDPMFALNEVEFNLFHFDVGENSCELTLFVNSASECYAL